MSTTVTMQFASVAAGNESVDTCYMQPACSFAHPRASLMKEGRSYPFAVSDTSFIRKTKEGS